MGFILLLIIGFIAGLVAAKIMHSTYPWYIDVILGIVGAYVGSFILGLFGLGGSCITTACTGSGWLYQLIAGILGASIIIAIVHAVQREPIR